MSRLVVTSRLPTWWPKARGALLQANVYPHRGGRLAAKVFLFKDLLSMRRYWKKRASAHIKRQARAVVSELARHAVKIHADGSEGPERMEVDRRFFCMMGFARTHLSSQIIAHESVHAGYAYARRRARPSWNVEALAMDEEAVAYPAGAIAQELTALFLRHGFTVNT